MENITKYDFEMPKEVIDKNIMRLTNQLWKLIPMRENNEDWNKQLNTVIVEIAGMNKIFINCPQFLQLLSKLEGLTDLDLEFIQYRKVIFESINLLQELKKDERWT